MKTKIDLNGKAVYSVAMVKINQNPYFIVLFCFVLDKY